MGFKLYCDISRYGGIKIVMNYLKLEKQNIPGKIRVINTHIILLLTVFSVNAANFL